MSRTKRVLVVDNGGQWTHRIWRVLREIGCETEIISNTTPLRQVRADALVLSGGAPRIAWESPKLGNCIDYLTNYEGPILGICVGLQLMAIQCGGNAGPSLIPEYGLAKIRIVDEDELFKGLPSEFLVWESHNDEVKTAPNFSILAVSDNCSIQAVKHDTKPFYGVQFHPEVNNTQFGEQIFRNFIGVIT